MRVSKAPRPLLTPGELHRHKPKRLSTIFNGVVAVVSIISGGMDISEGTEEVLLQHGAEARFVARKPAVDTKESQHEGHAFR